MGECEVDGVVGLIVCEAEGVFHWVGREAYAGCEMVEKGVFGTKAQGGCFAVLYFYGCGPVARGVMPQTDI